jgi:hypothetical protein
MAEKGEEKNARVVKRKMNGNEWEGKEILSIDSIHKISHSLESIPFIRPHGGRYVQRPRFRAYMKNKTIR